MPRKLTRLLTQEEVMERLQISRVTLWRWRRMGLPTVKVGRSIRFDWEAVVTWVKDHEVDRGPSNT